MSDVTTPDQSPDVPNVAEELSKTIISNMPSLTEFNLQDHDEIYSSLMRIRAMIESREHNPDTYIMCGRNLQAIGVAFNIIGTMLVVAGKKELHNKDHTTSPEEDISPVTLVGTSEEDQEDTQC